jgi:hypothetical protein
MTHAFRTMLAPIVVVAAAACSGTQPLDDSLVRDLDRAQSTALELAPAGQSLQLVSEIEGGPAARPAPPAEARPRTVARRTTPPVRPAAQRPAPRDAEPVPVAPRPQPAAAPAREVADYPATPRPESAPLGAGPPPPGGWKSVGEVLRTIPIPIKP